LGYRLMVAVDESTGHVLVGDPQVKNLYEFDQDGNFVDSLVKPPAIEVQFPSMTIDNSEDSPNQGFLYVPSGEGTAGNLFAYEPKIVPETPKIESLSVSGLTEDEAVLKATVNPKGAPTHWALEYVTQQHFDEEGFSGAQLAGEGELPTGNEGAKVSA